MDTYSHLLEDIGGDAVDGLDDAFGKAILALGGADDKPSLVRDAQYEHGHIVVWIVVLEV
jgi:hypothetical protein